MPWSSVEITHDALGCRSCQDGYYSKKPSQDSYSKTEFGLNEQERLANYVWSLHDKGIYVIVSNSDHPVIRKFYKGLKLRQLNLRRTVNMFSTKNHSELLITNF